MYKRKGGIASHGGGIEQDVGWKRNEKATCDSELTIVVSFFHWCNNILLVCRCRCCDGLMASACQTANLEPEGQKFGIGSW
jgi:hypothetical protein